MTPGDRDRHVEQWLESQGEPLPASPSGGTCIDAECAAAWLDGQLPDLELRRAQAHVAGCGHCQLLLRTLMETELAAEVPVLADHARSSRGEPRETPATVAPWRGWLTWGAPLGLAAAALLAVGVWRQTPAPSLSSMAGTNATAGPSAADAVPPAEDRQVDAVPPVQTTNAARAESPAAAPVPVPPSSAMSKALAPSTETEAARTQAAENGIQGGVVGGIVGGVAGASDTAAAPPPPPPPPAPASPAPAVARPAPATTGSADAALRERSTANLARASETPIDVRASAGRERWRVSGSRIEWSADEGRSWTDVAPAGALTLLGASAPASGVCWFVGRGGAVLLVTNRGAQSLRGPGSDDLVRVDASSAREAAVTTAGGRRFHTADAGSTWQPEP